MSSNEAVYLKRVLRDHDASGERLANRLRFFAAAIGAVVMSFSWAAQTRAAGLVFVSCIVSYMLFAAAWGAFALRDPERFRPWMSFVSVAVDVTFFHTALIGSLLNHSGVYEVFRGPSLWLVIGMSNGVTALRGNPRVSYSAFALTLVYGALMLLYVHFALHVPWVPDSTYLGEGLNLPECVQDILFAAVPALAASVIARRSRELALRAAEQERLREKEREQLEWRLKVADRMVTVGTMAAGVAHEVNNPLTYVLANLDTALSRLAAQEGTADVRRTLGHALEGAQRVQTIVAALKTFSRIDEGPRQPVDVRATVDAALTMASSELRHRARVQVEHAGDVTVLANEAKLGQVFLNLVVNAAQAIEGDPDENLVRVRTSRHAGQVTVEVSDTGNGIAEAHRARIFDPFFTTKPVGSGTGLGLSICHSIISELDGSIEVQSELGRGATFRVTLPATDEPVPQRSSQLHPVSSLGRGRGRVLVVDDDRLVSEALEMLLSEEHEVILLDRADQALARIDAGEHFDVIVCDLMMPAMGGIELHAALLSAHPQVAQRMLFATGGAFTPSAQAFVARMGSRVVTKPFRGDVLRESVRRVLEASERTSQSAQVEREAVSAPT